jgi:hypothetical protein
MTEKENYFLMLEGKQPMWVPRATFAAAGVKAPTTQVAPYVFSYHRFRPGPQIDCWGVTHVPVEECGGAKIPEPGKFILRDIGDWRKVIKLPDLSEYDFEAEAKEQLSRIDRSETAVIYDLSAGFFQLLVEFMGFTEGLMAMAIDPDEVYDLFSYMADFFDEVAKRTIDAYRPDIFGITDDVASAKNLFMSHEMWQELVKPFQIRLAKHANELGIPIDMHCCGKCEALIDEWMEFGVKIWNPPQDMNDLIGIKEKYGRSLILNGCSSPSDAYNFSWSTEEEIRECIRNKVDKYAPGGSYIFRAYVLGAKDDPTTANRNFWSVDEYPKYGRDWYSRH